MSTATPVQEPLGHVLSHLNGVRRNASGWEALCPAHEDANPSLTVAWSAQAGDSGGVVLRCHRGCVTADVLTAAGLDWRDLFPPSHQSPTAPAPTRTKRKRGKIVATYDYEDEQGQLLYQVVRFDPKDFRQRRPNGNGKWKWSLGDVRRVPFRLPAVRAAIRDRRAIFIVEGEKDVLLLEQEGFVATCNAGGADKGSNTKWRPELNEHFAGARVVILPDNDEPGWAHAQHVAQQLQGVAAEVQIVELPLGPRLPKHGKDVTDWFEGGGNAEELKQLVRTTGEKWKPDAAVRTSVSSTRLLDPANPRASAEAFLRDKFTYEESRTLHEFGGVLYTWTGSHYREMEPAELRAAAWEYAGAAERLDKDGERVPFRPTTPKVNNLIDALRGLIFVPAYQVWPRWIGCEGPAPADQIFALRNGLLDIGTRMLYPHTPRFLSTAATEFDYTTATPPEPVRWLQFLEELWGDDHQAISTLQEIFAYLLTPDTRQQKAFMIVGPKRSGKGTIARVLSALIGKVNVASPTLESLTTPFGLQPLIGKRLAIVSDARLGGRADQAALAERLLTISGEDSVTIDRKYLPPWTGSLAARFLVLTNELPRISDASGALASRFIILTIERSFYGAEDPTLTEQLLEELPSIFAWALDGWDRLTERGHFVQPASSADALREMEDLGSPVGAFVRDQCIVEPGRSIACGALWEAWLAWCRAEGRDRHGTKQTFGRDLRAAVSGLKQTHRRVSGGRERFYEGIGLGPL